MHCSDIFVFRNDAKADWLSEALKWCKSRLWLSLDAHIGSTRFDSYTKQ